MDITKCHGKNCLIREACWRYLAPDDRLMQAYADFSDSAQPTNTTGPKARLCDMFMAVRGKGWKR